MLWKRGNMTTFSSLHCCAQHLRFVSLTSVECCTFFFARSLHSNQNVTLLGNFMNEPKQFSFSSANRNSFYGGFVHCFLSDVCLGGIYSQIVYLFHAIFVENICFKKTLNTNGEISETEKAQHY